jgi:glycosyltransferase involved in cell wall biosynthesis
MQRPKVSIVTRTRDREQFLARAMASVLGQVQAPPWEWIIVNDAGERELVEAVLKPARARFPEAVRILHLSESKGMEHASNQGIASAQGDYVVIHDDDDSWEPGFLREMAAWLDSPENAASAGVICHSVRVVETVQPDGIEEVERHLFNGQLERLSFWEVLQENPFPPISFLFRRSVLDELGPFNEALPVLGDWEFNLRVLARHPVGVLPKALAFYHHRTGLVEAAHANTVTAANDLHRQVESRLREEWSQSNPFGAEGEAFAHAVRMAGNLHRLKVSLGNLADRTGRLPRPVEPQF